MVVFIRGNFPFLSPDQIYVKLLPNGGPVQLTHDPRQKYGLAFSPDGSRIAYTAVDHEGWRTFTVSPLGGEPRLLLSNSPGLTLMDGHPPLFSRIQSGLPIGIVTSPETPSPFPH